ncbi:MAG: SPOR domain-containing protein [Muribaculaceae bacterium]|nr:SPOR domain-containing protein [Muribaculaceae bacterium]
MNRLAFHILSLLRLYDSVALPGLGVFVIHYSPARISEEQARFLPPHFALSFNPDSNTFDSLLLDSYIRKENLSPAQARAELEADMSALTEALKAHGSVSLLGIGTFSLTSSSSISNLSFSPAFALASPLPAIGLKPLVAPVEEEAVQESGQPEATRIEEDSRKPREVVRVEIPENYRYRNPAYYYIPIHKQVAKIAACLLLVFIVALAVVLPVGQIQNNSSTASISPIRVCDTSSAPKATVAPLDTLTPIAPDSCAADTVCTTEAVADTVNNGGSNVRTLPSLHKEKAYYAIVGAFKSEKEVERFLAENHKDRNALEVVKNRSYYMVAVASAADKAELENNMPLIRTSYPDAWIYAAK